MLILPTNLPAVDNTNANLTLFRSILASENNRFVQCTYTMWNGVQLVTAAMAILGFT